MNKFKVGDKVKIILPKYNGLVGKVAKIYTTVDVNLQHNQYTVATYMYELDFDKSTKPSINVFTEGALELFVDPRSAYDRAMGILK